MNFSIKLILVKLLTMKLILVPICVILCHQSWFIFNQYSQQNYVTNIKFIKNHIGTLPAVTICYDRYLSLQNFFNRFPNKNFEVYYNKLMDDVENLRWDQIDGNKQNQIINMVQNHFNIQHQIMNNGCYPFLVHFLSDYQDFFENLTMHSTITENNMTRYLFRPLLTGHFVNLDQDDDSLTYIVNKTLTLEPIESMFYLMTPPRKCFTMFSALDPNFRNVKGNLKHLSIPIHFPRQWFPYRKAYEITVSVHSPNIIPLWNTFKSLYQLGDYNLVYSKVENQENTNSAFCANYDLNKDGNFNMKSDCHYQCLIKQYGLKCQLILMLQLSLKPFRKTLFPDKVLDLSDSNNTCQFDHLDYFFKEEECQKKCPDECHQEYYFLDLKMTEKLSDSIPMKNRSSELKIVPSSRPKIIITHLPEMTLMSLVCNFGGLLGIWLGLSALDILTYLWKYYNLIHLKLMTENNINNSQLFIRKNYINSNGNVCPRESIQRN